MLLQVAVYPSFKPIFTDCLFVGDLGTKTKGEDGYILQKSIDFSRRNSYSDLSQFFMVLFCFFDLFFFDR